MPFSNIEWDMFSILQDVRRKARIIERWKKPVVGLVKFNVDGAARGKPGLSVGRVYTILMER